MSTVGEYFRATKLRGIDEGVGAPGLVQSMHGTPRDGSFELITGTPGPVGAQGEQAATFRWEGDISDPVALAALATRLGTVHAGRAWRVKSTDTLMYWNGSGFETFTDAFGAPGPDGKPCSITIGTVDTGPVGSDLRVTLTGTAPNLVLNLVVPRGIKGRKGDPGGPGPIREASDYLDGPLVDRAVPIWSETAQKWKLQPYPGLRGPWSLVEARAWDDGPGFAPGKRDINVDSMTVAQLKIPAQDTDWRPVLGGGVVTSTTEPHEITSVTRVDTEVRLGSPTGQIVALGAGFPMGVDGIGYLQPYYGVRSMTPDSTVGVVPAGQATTLYVVLRRKGTSTWIYYQSNAQIICWARPITTS
ncbi:hypothetical protein NDR87_27710 [Nocardia sp. CDC159]|uniref:Minor tail protein n=1 Tax=Nocardia pulmonis TaxID=2951408 RepID=A0A9X2J025_9NOCA|nr:MULTISPECIES: hypothetical protein [Nocardia]MCM6777279.1 hypothetical protein [Nocardia pulmonis]MCM6790164.1 hypothetical protein [Nocardia sp. CDC159]